MFFFGFFPIFIIPLILIYFAFRTFPRIFRSLFREMENRSQYKNRLISPSRRQQFNARKLRKLKAGEIEGVIFNIAYQLRGRITLSDIIIETGLSMKESEEVINKMVDSVRVRMEVDENGLVIYEFPEIIARFQNGTDH